MSVSKNPVSMGDPVLVYETQTGISILPYDFNWVQKNFCIRKMCGVIDNENDLWEKSSFNEILYDMGRVFCEIRIRWFHLKCFNKNKILLLRF